MSYAEVIGLVAPVQRLFLIGLWEFEFEVIEDGTRRLSAIAATVHSNLVRFTGVRVGPTSLNECLAIIAVGIFSVLPDSTESNVHAIASPFKINAARTIGNWLEHHLDVFRFVVNQVNKI